MNYRRNDDIDGLAEINSSIESDNSGEGLAHIIDRAPKRRIEKRISSGHGETHRKWVEH